MLSALVEENVAAMHNIDQLASKTPGLAAICSTVAMVRGYTEAYTATGVSRSAILLLSGQGYIEFHFKALRYRLEDLDFEGQYS